MLVPLATYPQHDTIPRPGPTDGKVQPAHHQTARLGERRRGGEGKLRHHIELPVAPDESRPAIPNPKLFRQQSLPQGRVACDDLQAVTIPEHVLPTRIGQDDNRLTLLLDNPACLAPEIRLPD